MIVGFLGKGGSGKSTLATGMVRFMRAQDARVLAIDADHNMDLAYNLGYNGSGPYLSEAYRSLNTHVGLDKEKHWSEALFVDPPERATFTLEPKDVFTAHFSTDLEPKLHLMMAGPQSDAVLYGESCSHTLASALKAYLPLLELEEGQCVVVDEKASVDAVTTGIPSGFDLAVVVMEPKEHSVRVAKQIAEMLQWYQVPFVLVLNKVQDKAQTQMVEAVFGRQPDALCEATLDTNTISQQETVFEMIRNAAQEATKTQSRLERTRERILRNRTFAH